MTQKEVRQMTLGELVQAVMKKINHWLEERIEYVRALKYIENNKTIRFVVGNKGHKPLTDVQREEVMMLVESLCKMFGLSPKKTRDDITVAWSFTVPE